MAEYVLTGSRSWDTTYAAQNGDGTGTFWANSFLPFFNRMTTIAYYLVEGGAVPASGASLNSQGTPDGTTRLGFAGYTAGATAILAGPLRTALEAMIEAVETKQRRQRSVSDYFSSDGDKTISGAAGVDEVVIMINAAAADRDYTLAAPAGAGLVKHILRKGAGTNNVTLLGLGNVISLTFGSEARGVTLVSTASEWLLVTEWEAAP